jgi:hypothetical protein
MADLSPAAQAIMIAATNGNHNCQADPVYRQCIAAALHAAADQVVPESKHPQRDSFSDRSVWQWAVDCHRHDADTRSKILAIAAELEA